MQPIFSKHTASITELKRNPSALIKQAQGSSIAILNHNKPSAYLVPVATFEQMMAMIEDVELTQIVNQRLNDGQAAFAATRNEL